MATRPVYDERPQNEQGAGLGVENVRKAMQDLEESQRGLDRSTTITFEVMVLFAGVGTVIALFIACRLYPGKKAKLAYPGVTDDRFAILLEEEDATFDVEEITRLCKHFHSTHVEERTEESD